MDGMVETDEKWDLQSESLPSPKEPSLFRSESVELPLGTFTLLDSSRLVDFKPSRLVRTKLHAARLSRRSSSPSLSLPPSLLPSQVSSNSLDRTDPTVLRCTLVRPCLGDLEEVLDSTLVLASLPALEVLASKLSEPLEDLRSVDRESLSTSLGRGRGSTSETSLTTVTSRTSLSCSTRR